MIPLLEARGLHVVSVQNPLSSLADDTAAARRAIEQQTGPVVLVGHSCGGVVITQAGSDDKVKALVYVAALVPDSGESVNDLMKNQPAPAWAGELRKDSANFLTLYTKAVVNDFAQDLPPAQARIIATTQGPWSAGCLDDKVSTAGPTQCLQDSSWRMTSLPKLRRAAALLVWQQRPLLRPHWVGSLLQKPGFPSLRSRKRRTVTRPQFVRFACMCRIPCLPTCADASKQQGGLNARP